jgi:pimeloyl-ACP methyl ester carboxylesterase
MAKTPVVFVPGLGGSFNLLVLLDWSAPTLSGWNFPPFVDYGKNFVDTFTRAGYTRDSDLFVAFYDWRKSVVDSATNYLMPWIDRARKQSGSDKVILVGHSMGGLVARSYIQSDAYRGDVERLITLGTPHRGSADAYYPWEGGAMNWDAVANAVFGVYLWYLEHAHPFQSQLNRLNTIRTQAPGVRDLLPLFDYLQSQGGPPALTPCQKMLERNLLGDLLLAPAGLERLLTRTPLTTIAGSGFVTIQSIVVGSPPAPPDRPPLFVDGAPASTTTTGSGDGTVLLISAAIDDPRVRNLPPVQVVHDSLPDKAVAQVLTELNVAVPAVADAPASQPRLVILTASPLELTVETPAAAPAVLSEAGSAARPRRRSVKGKNYGHRGKRLNMAIIPAPAAGTYNVRLRGTATGTFALGVLLVGAGDQAASIAPVTLGEAGDGVPAKAELTSPIDTVHGQVAAETELRYQVVLAPEAAPRVRFDAEATTRDALARLSAAAAAPGPMVLGDESAPPQVPAVLSATEAPDDVRATVTAALVQGDAGAATRLAAQLAAADGATFELLRQVAEQVVAPRNRALALGLLEQLRQVAVLSAGTQ